MTRRQVPTDERPYNTAPEHTPRLRLKPKGPRSGYVDGAWWPRSDDLAAELPDLLAVLSVRLGRIDRVLYNLDEWANASAELVTHGEAVRLEECRLQSTDTVEVIGLNDTKIVLLVVPSNVDPDGAHATLMAAAAPRNDSTVDSLLMISARDRELRTHAADAQVRWGSAD